MSCLASSAELSIIQLITSVHLIDRPLAWLTSIAIRSIFSRRCSVIGTVVLLLSFIACFLGFFAILLRVLLFFSLTPLPSYSSLLASISCG